MFIPIDCRMCSSSNATDSIVLPYLLGHAREASKTASTVASDGTAACGSPPAAPARARLIAPHRVDASSCDTGAMPKGRDHSRPFKFLSPPARRDRP